MNRTRKATARRTLDVVEAAYSLGGTDPEWMTRVVDAASSDLEQGRGCYGFSCRIENGQIRMGSLYVERDLDPRFGALVEMLNREVPNAVVDVLAGQAVICGGFGEVLGTKHPGTAHFQSHGRAIGITDAFSIFAQDGEGWAIDLSGPADGTVVTPPRVRGIWRRVGLHVAAGLRLRRRLVERQEDPDAVLDPSGKVEHAVRAPRRDVTAREALITSVRRMERARTAKERRDPERALELWRGLVAGEWSLVEQWESDGRRYIAAYRNRPDVRDPRALTRHERAVLHYAALGASNKEIAFTLGLPVGSVGTAVSQLLQKLGCRNRTGLIAFGAPALASAQPPARLDLPLANGEQEVAVLSMSALRNQELLGRLTLAEQEVAEQLLSGAATAGIARARKTSAHTVSNQIRCIFQKVGVQSRAELVRALTR